MEWVSTMGYNVRVSAGKSTTYSTVDDKVHSWDGGK